MCRRTKCRHAITSNGVDVVLYCGFYPLLKDLPEDCHIPYILADLSRKTEDIIDLVDEVIS